MKAQAIVATLIAFLSFAVTSHAQSSPFSLEGESLKDKTEILPFVLELATVKLRPFEKEVPNELRVTITGEQIEIAGTKKTDVRGVKGRLAGHFGKIVLFKSALPRTGKLLAKIPSIHETTCYGISLDLTTGILLSKEITLLSGVQYEWSARQVGIDFVLEVTMDGSKVDSIRTDAATVKGFGIFSTVRYPGSKADLIIDVKPTAPNAR